MCHSHWGLSRAPFTGDLVLKFLDQSPTHEEALARLQYLVVNHRRLGLLMGPSGSGKSLVLEAFARRLRRDGLPVVKINLLGLDAIELLWALAIGLKINPQPTASEASLWLAITDKLAEFHYQQFDTVVLLDDAASVHTDVLSQVARLARYDSSTEPRLTLILAGHAEKICRLDRSLLELVELRIDLEPWEQADTANFLKLSLANAGGNAKIFSQSAISRLHELTHGIPRRTVQLADLSLLAGAGANLKQIDADIVESVYQELSIAGVS